MKKYTNIFHIFIPYLLFCLIAQTLSTQIDSIHQLEHSSINDRDSHTFSKNLRVNQKQNHKYSDGKAEKIIFALYALGPALFISSFGVIWLNERKAVIDYRALEWAQNNCQKVNHLNEKKILEMNEKLVYVSGYPETNKVLTDSSSGIRVTSAFKMVKTVQVKEWRHAIINNQASYYLQWESSNLPELGLKTNPPGNWFIINQTFVNEDINLGGYKISGDQFVELANPKLITPTMQNIKNIINSTAADSDGEIIDGYIYFPSKLTNDLEGQGALRVKFEYYPIGPITIVAKSVGNKLQPFQLESQQRECCVKFAKKLNCLGMDELEPLTKIHFIFQQLKELEDIFKTEKQKTEKFKNVTRLLSFFMMLGGYMLAFVMFVFTIGQAPLFLVYFIKGSLLVIGLVGGIIICIPLWIITFSLAWTWYHPKVGLLFLGMGIGMISGIVIISIKKPNNPCTAQEVTQTATETINHLLRHADYLSRL